MTGLPATASSLHSLPIWVDVRAMAVGAAFGSAVARNRRLPLFAVLLAGLIAGLAGSMARDVLLGLEAAAIELWYYIPAALAAALFGGLLAHRFVQGHTSYLLAQGLATSAGTTRHRWGAEGSRIRCSRRCGHSAGDNRCYSRWSDRRCNGR